MKNYIYTLLVLVFLGLPNLGHAQIGNIECNAVQNTPFISNNFDNLKVRNAFFTFPNRVIDSNLNNSSGSGFLVFSGGWISVEDRDDVYPAGTYAGWNINMTSLTIGSAGFIRISTKLNGREQERMQVDGADLFTIEGRRDVGFVTTQDFDEIRFDYFAAGVGIPSATVFYAVVNRFCEGPQVDCNTSNLASNTATPLQRPDFPVYVNPERTGVNGLIELSRIDNVNALISPNDNDFATLVELASVATVVDLSVKNGKDTYPAGTWAGYEIENNELVGADIFDIVQITTFNNGQELETKTGELLLAGTPLFNFGDRRTVGFTTTQDFDEIRIRFIRPVGVSVFGTTKIYNAVIKEQCEGDPFVCNVQTAVTSPNYPVNINMERTGNFGVACVACRVLDADEVIDDDPNNYASLGTIGTALTSTSISVQKAVIPGQIEPWQAGTMAGFEIQTLEFVDVDAIDVLTVQTFLNGVEQESSSDVGIAKVNSILLNGTGREIVGFETTRPYDEVVIRTTNVASVNLGGTRVYSLVIQDFCDFDRMVCGLDNDNTTERLSVPNDPVFIDAKRSGVNGIACVGCDLRNTNNIIDNDPSTYVTLNEFAQVGSAASLAVKFGGNNVIEAGNFAGFEIKRDNFLDADVFSGITIRTFLNGDLKETVTGEFAVASVNTDILADDGKYTIGIVNTEPFDEFQILFAGLSSVDLGNTKVYDAVFMKACSKAVDCNNSYYLTQPEFPVVLNAGRTGVGTLACVGCAVTAPDNVIDSDPTNHATINTTANVIGSSGLSVVDVSGTYPIGTYAGFTINPGFPINVDVLEFITINTYLDGVQQESKTSFDLVDIVALIPIWGVDTGNVGFYTSKPFDEVEIRVSGLANAINVIEVYGLLIDTRNIVDAEGNPLCSSLIAINDINQTQEGVAVSGNVLTNDIDPEGGTITVQTMTGLDVNGNPIEISTNASSPTTIYDENGNVAGTISYNQNTGEYTFTPADDFVGEVPIKYTAIDDGGDTDNASLTIQVIPIPVDGVNNPPVANDDTAITPFNTPVTGSVLGNDSDPDGDDLTVNTNPVSGPSHGSVVINPDGTFTYTPDNGFVGDDSFEYEVCDNGTPSLCTTATVTVSVIPDDGENKTFANDDANQGKVNEILTGNVLDNDTDPEGDAQTVIGAKDTNGNTLVVDGATENNLPNGGKIVINPDGSYVYTPGPGFVGTEQIVYEISDGNGATDKATLYLTSLDGNSLIANNDINQTPEGVPVSGNVLTNDVDPEETDIDVFEMKGLDMNGASVPISTDANNPTTIYDVNGNEAGDMSYNPETGDYTFIPADGFTGEVPLTYIAKDEDGAKDSAELTIQVIKPTVGGSNNPPVAHDDTATTPTGTSVTGNVLGNDSDPDGDDLIVNTNPVADPQNGSVVLNPDGTFTYTPNPGFEGEDSFEYEVCDNGNPSLCTTATVTITVVPDDGENATYANDDANTGKLNDILTGNVLDNDTDPQNDPQSVINAVDTAGNPLIVDGTTENILPSGGKIIINSDGTYTYTPAVNYVGNEQIVYEISDGNGATDTATLYLTNLALGNATNAINDINQTPKGVAASGNVLVNDTDAEGDAQHVLSARADTDGDGIVDDDLPIGVETTVYAENPLSAGNFIPAGEMTLLEDGSYTFTPRDSYIGTVPMEYTVQDDNVRPATDVATLTIEVIPTVLPEENNPPIAQDDTQGTKQNVPVGGNVLLNDSDPDVGDTLSVSAALADTDGDGIVDDPLSIGVDTPVYGTDINGNTRPAGSIVLNADGSYTYTPAPDFIGDVPVNYTAADPGGLTDDANLVISVYPENTDQPNVTYANADANAGPVNTPLTGNVLLNDSDPEGDDQSLTSLVDSDGNTLVIDGTTTNTLPSGGTITMDSNGNYNYIPATGFTGTETLVYTVCDDGSPVACAQTTLQLTSIPVAVPDYRINLVSDLNVVTLNNTPADFTINISEINGVASNGSPRVQFVVRKNDFVEMSFDPTFVGNWNGNPFRPVDNTLWTIEETEYYYLWTYTGPGNFPANGSLRIGINATFVKPDGFIGVTNITSVIPSTHVGGENNFQNNRSVKTIYFRF